MSLYEYGVVPPPVQNVYDLRARVARWNKEQVLLSDLPQVVGAFNNPDLLAACHDSAKPSFTYRYSGKFSVDSNGDLIDSIAKARRTEEQHRIATEVIAPIVLIAAQDARGFMALSDDEPVSFFVNYKAGEYVTHEGANTAHLDVAESGVSYLCATDPSTIFLPGTFNDDEHFAAVADSSNLYGVGFESGAVLRTTELQLHKAPTLESGVAVPRGLVLLDVME